MTTRVLAIDDSRTIRMLVSQALERAGYNVRCAKDGLEGLSAFEAFDPDIVITDINMPNLDGFGVLEALRSGQTKNSVPILVLTTESSNELKEKARKLGATGWIVKPFQDDSLVNIIQRVSGNV